MNPYEKIKELTNQNGISVRELEKRLGYSNGYFSKWKKVSPNSDGLAKVADYFGVSTDYLLGRINTPRLENEKKPKEIDVKDDTVIMTYGGKPLSDKDREIVLAATRALVEQRAREEEEKRKKEKN